MGEDLGYRAFFVVVFGSALVISKRVRGRADEAGGSVSRSEDPLLVQIALLVSALAFYLGLLVWLVYPPAMGWASLPISWLLRWTGAILLLVGTALGVVAIKHLGKNVTATSSVRKDAELVTTGPYRWVRHPLYTSTMFTLPGVGLLTANAFIFVAGMVALTVVLIRTKREEQELIKTFGDQYLEYARRTGALIPRWRR